MPIKNSDHISFQKFLKTQNPHLQIERPFEKILRIADLCWEQKKIVFEIQCSPIDAQTAQQRIRDYAQENYTIVWLLDDRYYNRRRFLRPEETILRENSGYYFSFDQKMIYDQLEVTRGIVRLAKGPALIIDLSQAIPHPPFTKPTTRQLEKRTRSFYFANDLTDKIRRHPTYLEELRRYEESLLAQNEAPAHLFFAIKKFFFIGLEICLRKLSF